MSESLRIRRVSKSFGEVEALREVSFSLAAGERLGLLGPNGAGKTTLVRCICGRVEADAGDIELMGQLMPSPRARQQLGFVPQELAFYADLTARQNLEVFARFYGLGRTELRERVAWALEWTGLADRADMLARHFSGGMKRRVNIACGVLHRPAVLLLDEPTVGIDPQSRERIYQMLGQLRSEGTAVLLTTHHLEEAEKQCDRIVVIDQGRIIADGVLNRLIETTVGRGRQVRIHLAADGEPFRGREPIAGLMYDGAGRLLRAEIEDLARDLPPLLHRIQAAGARITDIEVHAPSLHDVFLHLTGRELRE